MRRTLPILFVLAACGDGTTPPARHPVEDVPVTETFAAGGIDGTVHVVRDQWGVPHVYGRSLADVTYAQGFVMARDRLVQMDLARHKADGTLSELVGELAPSVIDGDIEMRAHHLRATAEAAWKELSESREPKDVELGRALTRFAEGVNRFIDKLKAGDEQLPPQLAFVYNPKTTKPWTAVDSILLGVLQAFSLSFDADAEITLSRLDAAGTMIFDQSKDPELAARKGIARDLQLLAPVDHTYSVNGWAGIGEMTRRDTPIIRDGNALAALEAASHAVRGVGQGRALRPSLGSNNWVVAPALSASGHAMVANDTHLDLSNPATFYLVHLVVEEGPYKGSIMGVQFPGIPGVVLGMNNHLAWGATVNYIDVTDVYQEQIVTCDGSSDPCVVFKGAKVKLVPRVEKFGVGNYGDIKRTETFTLYDVPHHGPIIPRVANHKVEALGGTELSIKYTGHQPAQLVRAVFGVDIATNVKEAISSLEKDFKYGGQNWVLADDQGNIGWTQTIRVPRRAPGAPPWKVLPGDGSAEWGADLDRKYIPHAYNPKQGYVATANADPIGVTDDGDPWNEPMVDGAPLYLAAEYDAGTRVGRITKRIKEGTASGKKLRLDDMQSIQADHVSEWGEYFAPTLREAAQALADEVAQPGKYPDIAAEAKGLSEAAKAALPTVLARLGAWKFGTPSATAGENPSVDQIRESQAAAVFGVWVPRLVERSLGDELGKLGFRPGGTYQLKLVLEMCRAPEKLATGKSQKTGDSILFDIIGTTEIESKRQIAVRALASALEYLVTKLGADVETWRWGRLHTLVLEFLAPQDALRIPLKNETAISAGFPRPGTFGTVDVADPGVRLDDDYKYSHGAAIRFVCEVTPDGPRARNALPGGETLDPASPHYRDQLELWRKNQTFDLAYRDTDVVESAKKEYEKNNLGRIVFTPATR